MIEYDREKHEMLILKWYLDLNSKPPEFANLFAKPLRNLTEILFWSSRTVKLFFEVDIAGIWCASWLEPCMSGAYWGVWVREDKRKSKAMLAHVNQSLDLALEHFPVLMAPTKQPRLEAEMARLGWIKEGDIPHLFDGDAAGVYWMDKASRNARHEVIRNARLRRRENIKQQQLDIEPLGGRAREDRFAGMEDGETGDLDVQPAGGGSPEDRRSEREHPEHQRRRGRKPPKLKPKRDPVARTVGA